MHELTSQYKFDLFTSKVSQVRSPATERHQREKQGDLELWAKEQELLDKLDPDEYYDCPVEQEEVTQ